MLLTLNYIVEPIVRIINYRMYTTITNQVTSVREHLCFRPYQREYRFRS